MPVLRPLRALRYGRDQRDVLDELISPAVRGEPDDRTIVGDVHPHNIRHLVRGDHGPMAGADDPPFTHAARLLRQWKEDGVLVRDARPGLYVYEQASGDILRRGIVCLLRLGDGLRPHEVSRGGSADTLCAQLAATRCQLSLVMAVVPDRTGALSDYLASQPGRPWIQVVDGNDVRNRVWIDEDPEAHVKLAEALADEVAVIADGHHRVEAALQHQRDCAEDGPTTRESPWDYVMTLIVPASDPGLVCRAAHRICEELHDAGRAFLETLDDSFTIEELAADGAEAFLTVGGPARFVLVTRGRMRGLTLRSDSAGAAESLRALPAPLRDVDAAILGALVLDPLTAAEFGAAWSSTGGDTGGAPSGSRFSHNKASASEIAAQAFDGNIDAAFLLRPTPPGQVVGVAEAGELMPPKSTNFQPKPIKGLLLNSLVSF